MDHLESDELVVAWRYGADEKEGGVASVDDFGVWLSVDPGSVCPDMKHSGYKRGASLSLGPAEPRERASELHERAKHRQTERSHNREGAILPILTLVFQEITHPSPPGQYQLRYILYYLRLRLVW
jgi:hypothetical protein